MRTKAQDRLTSMEVVEPGGYLLVLTQNGFGKRTDLTEYTSKGRATGGVRTIAVEHLPIIGKVVAARVVQEQDQITVMTSAGMVLRLRVDGINAKGRTTRGVRVMDLAEGDKVASVARIEVADINRQVAPNGAVEPVEVDSPEQDEKPEVE
jgi:DNA gyrase subunit A